jgi:flagellar FliL protein
MATVTDRTLTGTGRSVPGQRSGAPVGTDEAPPRRSRKKLLVGAAVMLVALLAAAGGGYAMLTGAAAPSAETAEAAAEAAPEPGHVTPLDAITVNLADGRYLQVGIALQEVAAEGGGHGPVEAVDGSQALDILIDHLSGMQMSELAEPEQRQAVKAELVAEISEAYHGHVYDIYFTSFVMQ